MAVGRALTKALHLRISLLRCKEVLISLLSREAQLWVDFQTSLHNVHNHLNNAAVRKEY